MLSNDIYHNATSIKIEEVIKKSNGFISLINDIVFEAMDAFQFQDISKQKLMKVIHTLAKLNEYLNELLGSEMFNEKTFGRHIDQKTLQKDKDKTDIDNIVSNFKKDNK